MMTGLIGWLPITVWAAITVFVARELLEAVRRHRSMSRKLSAYKSALARECELNLWSLKSLEHAVYGAERALSHVPPQIFAIESKPGSYEQWRRTAEDNQLLSGGGLPPVKRSTIESSMIPIAELDGRLFAALQKGLDGIADLDHLRGSLFNYSRTNDPIEKSFFEGFLEYAKGEIPNVTADLNALYEACTGKPLTKHRLR